MTKSRVSRFQCPNCDASYMVVRVEAEPAKLYRDLECRSCGGPLDARNGPLILKYFLLEDGNLERPTEPGRRKHLA
jgi:hypothetical protein